MRKSHRPDRNPHKRRAVLTMVLVAEVFVIVGLLLVVNENSIWRFVGIAALIWGGTGLVYAFAGLSRRQN